MKEDFKRTTVICSAVVSFAAAAYFGGSAVVGSFDQAVKASVERNSAKLDAVENSDSADAAPSARPQSVLPKKFGITIER